MAFSDTWTRGWRCFGFVDFSNMICSQTNKENGNIYRQKKIRSDLFFSGFRISVRTKAGQEIPVQDHIDEALGEGC